MRQEDSALNAALKAYVSAASQAVHDLGIVPEPESTPGWHARVDDFFVFRDLRGVDGDLVSAVTAQHSLPEFGAAIEVLRAHPVIGPRIDKLVGTRFGRTLLEVDRLPDQLLYRLLRKSPDDANAVDEALDRFVESITFETTSWIVLAPLSGVAAEQLPIELERGVEIVHMSDEEVIACLDTGLIAGFGSQGTTTVTNRVAIRLTEEWPAVIGDDADDALDHTGDPYARRADLVESIVHALRLLKNGDVSVPGTVAFSRNSFGGWGRHFGFSPAPRHSDFERYRLRTQDIDELVTLWQGLRSTRVQGQRFLITATRRLAFSGERPRPDDRILDLMISAEALFTPGTQTEVAHKVALHAAAFLESGEFTPTQIFKTMKQGYSARSTIAHGGEAEVATLVNGEAGTLEGLVALVSALMRDAIKQMIMRAQHGTLLSDQAAWNALVLDRLGTSSSDATS